MPRCFLPILLLCLWGPLSAQQDNKSPVNRIFYLDLNQAKEKILCSELSTIRIPYGKEHITCNNYIWLKEKKKWRLYDSLLQEVMLDSLNDVTDVTAWTESSSWFSLNDNWHLWNAGKGTIIKTVKYSKILSPQFSAIFKNGRWNFCNPQGIENKVSVSSYSTIKANKNIVIASIYYNSWFEYDLINDRKSDFLFSEHIVVGEYLLKQLKNQWYWRNVNGNDAELDLQTKRIIHAGDTCSLLFVYRNGWNLVDVTNPTQPIHQHIDSALINNYTGRYFGIIQGKVYELHKNTKKELCINPDDIRYITTDSRTADFSSYSAEKLNRNLNDAYLKGISPEEMQEHEVVKSKNWRGESYSYLFQGKEKVGLCNIITNEITILPLFTEIEAVGSGFYIVTYEPIKDKSFFYGLLDQQGEVVIPVQYSELTEVWINNGTNRFFIAKITTGLFDVYDWKGVKVNSSPLMNPDPKSDINCTVNADCGTVHINFETSVPGSVFSFEKTKDGSYKASVAK